MRTETVIKRTPLRVVLPDEVPAEIAAMRADRTARRVMIALIVPAIALVMIGLVFVLSASSVRAYAMFHNSFWYFERQVVAAVVGVVVACLAYRVRYTTWRTLWFPLVAGCWRWF
jgi:cell division protein FtsW